MTATETDSQLPTLGRLARRTANTLIGALHNRAELFILEFEEANVRLLKIVIFAFGAVFLAMLALLLITSTVIFLTAEEYRVYVAGGFAALYLIGTVASGLTIKSLLQKPPFVESLKQFKKDSEILDAFK